jgi:hypothetical protein
MGLFDRRSDQERQALRRMRDEHRSEARAEAQRLRADQQRFEEERDRRRREEEDRLRAYDMRDGRFDGRPY